MASPTFRSPPPLLLALEQLAMLECGLFLAAAPALAVASEGDGHPVLVLPAFTTSDLASAPLRAVLRLKGYATYGWKLGWNIGPHDHVVRGMSRRLTVLRHEHDRRLTLIGWSLGGVYARELARRHPDAVRQVITLASPYRFRRGDRSHASILYDLLAPSVERFLPETEPEESRTPLTVPATSIYTRTDGVVGWRACIDSPGPGRENIEVRGTHSGLLFNLAAIAAITDRLAQPEGSWTPFRPPASMRHLFPSPASWPGATTHS
jgi:pimeloyl-ACP methyl ester carboxylesterase